MGKIIEGVWDCAYCGAKKVRGGLRECPQCGHPRDENVTFYIDNPQNYVYDEKQAEKARRGPDWVCPSCDCLNAADDTVCKGCGTPRDADTKDYFENAREKHASYKQERSDFAEFVLNDTPVQEPVTPPSRSKPNINWKTIGKYGAVVLLVIAVIAGITALLIPREISGVVTDIAWARSIEIEQYKTVRETGWSIPAGGREISHSQQIHHYDSVIDHYETKTRTYTEQVLDHYEEYVSGHRDLGNGHFEEIISRRPVYRTETRTETYKDPVYKQVPVYQTQYVYDIEKWVHQSYKETSGKDLNPQWATYECAANERESTRSEKYTVTVRTDDETRDYTLPLEQWQTLTVGQEIKLKTNAFGNAELIIKEEKSWRDN